jgi:hypothetical protein
MFGNVRKRVGRVVSGRRGGAMRAGRARELMRTWSRASSEEVRI